MQASVRMNLYVTVYKKIQNITYLRIVHFFFFFFFTMIAYLHIFAEDKNLIFV